jgi:hypothetical protein
MVTLQALYYSGMTEIILPATLFSKSTECVARAKNDAVCKLKELMDTLSVVFEENFEKASACFCILSLLYALHLFAFLSFASTEKDDLASTKGTSRWHAVPHLPS